MWQSTAARLVIQATFVVHLLAAWAVASTSAQSRASKDALALNATPPATPQRLIFIHHSTGENWLADDNGGLGTALRDNNYYVSDTNYGWGPDEIGSRTDIGNWYEWFLSASSSRYMAALFNESGQWASYSRLPAEQDPGGPNTIVMFKSCFPNSALQGDPHTDPPSIDSNPLRGQDAYSEYHTVANARGIYMALLSYFATQLDKLFVVIAAPPLSDPTYSSNARFFNQWLYNDWLKDYPHNNVAVFDFFDVLTTNGGSRTTNDLGRATGNHHRYLGGVIQHIINGDTDDNPNVLEYASGDDHPSKAGSLKATGEYLPLLNIFWHCWKGDGACPKSGAANVTVPQAPTGLIATGTGSRTVVVTWDDTSSDEAEFVVSRHKGMDSPLWVDGYRTLGAGTHGFTDNAAQKNPTKMTYSYTVKACNTGGCSESTAEAMVPFVPIKVKATRTASGQVQVTWEASSDNQSGFRVYGRKAPCKKDGWEIVADVNTTETAWVNDGLEAGVKYSYKMVAYTRSGGSEGISMFSKCVSTKA